MADIPFDTILTSQGPGQPADTFNAVWCANPGTRFMYNSIPEVYPWISGRTQVNNQFFVDGVEIGALWCILNGEQAAIEYNGKIYPFTIDWPYIKHLVAI